MDCGVYELWYLTSIICVRVKFFFYGFLLREEFLDFFLFGEFRVFFFFL